MILNVDNMNASELRIGNLIVLGSIIATVSIIEKFKGTNAINEVNQDMICPIPLTKDWLKKLGLKKHSVDDFYFIELEEYILQVVVNGFSGTLKKDSSWFVSITTGFGSQPVTITKKYVHEIQNLYFALSNKELTINK